MINASAATSKTHRTRGLYTRLHLLILATALPLLLIGTIAIAVTARDYRENSEQRLQETASALARGVDQSIEDNINQLLLLSMLAPDVHESDPKMQVWARQNPNIRLIHNDKAESLSLPPRCWPRRNAAARCRYPICFPAVPPALPR